MAKIFKHGFLYFPFLILLFALSHGESLSQSVVKDEKGPHINLGKINFKIREIESTPSPLKLLELHIEILNKGRQSVAPSNSIRVAVVPKEVKFAPNKSGGDLGLTSEETTLNLSIPPGTGRVLIIGFTIPKEGIESITFEVQINPPEGDKKTVSFNL
jgi:hypothetical protein